jgi:stage IV sporulation protein FB
MDWNWSFHAFRLFGVDVRIHWSLPAFFLYYVVRGAQLGYSRTTLSLFVVLPMVLLFASVVAHEYGHVFAARRFRLSIGHMILTPIGGMVMVAQGRTPKHELGVAIAGPLVNLALAIITAALYFAIGGPPTIEIFFPFFNGDAFKELWMERRLFPMVLFDFVQSQMMLFYFNMLCAAYPMDGGRVLMSILWRRRGFHPALIASCKIARIIAVVMGLAGIAMASPALVVIAFFVFIQANAAISKASLIPDPGRGFDVGFQRALNQQEDMKKAARAKNRRPWFFKRWMDEKKEAKLRSLLAKAETAGLETLTDSEREWLKRARESRKR